LWRLGRQGHADQCIKRRQGQDAVGIIPIVDVAPIYLGVQEGFFSDRNLDVTIETGQGGAAIGPVDTAQLLP
jgi:hypothetical protein